MYLGKALQVCISGLDKQDVIEHAQKYFDENEGWMMWNDVYCERKWEGWFRWKLEYKIDLYKLF